MFYPFVPFQVGTWNQNKWDWMYNNNGCCQECRIALLKQSDCLGGLTCQPNTMPGAPKGAGLCIGEGKLANG